MVHARELTTGDVLEFDGSERVIRSRRYMNTPDDFVLIAGNGLKTAHAIEFTFEDGKIARFHPGRKVRARKNGHQMTQ